VSLLGSKFVGHARIKPLPVGFGEHFLFSISKNTTRGFDLVRDGVTLHLFAFPNNSIRW
jgi:hypothetical protein